LPSGFGEEAARYVCRIATVRAFYRRPLHDVVGEQLELLEHHADARAIRGQLAGAEGLSKVARIGARPEDQAVVLGLVPALERVPRRRPILR